MGKSYPNTPHITMKNITMKTTLPLAVIFALLVTVIGWAELPPPEHFIQVDGRKVYAPPTTQIAEPVALPTLAPLTLADIEQWIARFDDRDPTVREAAIRHLLSHPQAAAEAVVQAFRTGNLNTRLTAIELLREWKAPVDELDPWQPATITAERLAALETWSQELAASSEPMSRELTDAHLAEATEEITRMLRVSDEETEVIRERLARMGTAFLPLVYQHLRTATTDRERQRLAALRYRLVASETLAQRWSSDGLLRLAAPETAIRRRSVDELANLATAEDQMLLRELFSDPDPLVREISLRGLQKIGGETQMILLDLLTDPELNVRAAVLKQLEDNPGSAASEKIIEYVRTETDADLVGHAVRVLRAFRRQGDSNATRCLIELLKHGSWQVRADAAEALGTSVRTTSPMTFSTTIVDGRVMRESADGTVKDAAQLQADVNAALVELLADPDSFVVSKAVAGLRSAGGNIDYAPLLTAIERSPDMAEHIIEMIASDSRIRTQAMPQLVKLSEHENPQIRSAIFSSAPILGEKELTAGLSDSESSVRIAAAKAVLRQLDSSRKTAMRTSRSYDSYSSWEPVRAEPAAPTVLSTVGRLFGFGSTPRTLPPPRPVSLPDGGTSFSRIDPIIDGAQPRFPVATALDGDEVELEIFPVPGMQSSTLIFTQLHNTDIVPIVHFDKDTDHLAIALSDNQSITVMIEGQEVTIDAQATEVVVDGRTIRINRVPEVVPDDTPQIDVIWRNGEAIGRMPTPEEVEVRQLQVAEHLRKLAAEREKYYQAESILPTVIPAQAGTQTDDVSPVSLVPRLRGGDGLPPVLVPFVEEGVEGQFRMASVEYPWKDILEGYADDWGLTLQADKMPTGTLGLDMGHFIQLSAEEQLKVLNTYPHLQLQNFVLIREEDMLYVIHIPDGFPEQLQGKITLDYLQANAPRIVPTPPLVIYRPNNEIPPPPSPGTWIPPAHPTGHPWAQGGTTFPAAPGNSMPTYVVPTPIQTSVIPAEAGIQTEDVHVVPLAPRLRGGDGEDGGDGEGEDAKTANELTTGTSELQNYIARNSSTITPEAYDRWLTNFYEGTGRPAWMSNLIEPLEAMLAAESVEEQVAAAAVLVLLGKTDEMVPFLIENVKANPDSFDSFGQVIPWLTSAQRLALFHEWREASEPDAHQLFGFLHYLREPADLRLEPIYWELLAEEDVPLDMVDGAYELLKPLYMVEDYDFDHNNRLPRSIQTQMADKLTAWSETGTEEQQLVAMALLVAFDTNKAREVAERIDADTSLSAELRFDAFQVRLMTQANDRNRTALAVETLKQKDPRRSRLAIRSLVNTDDFSYQMLRNRLFVYSPSAMRSVSLSSQRNQQSAPQGLELESILPLLTDENEGIAAYAGYFAVLLGDATGMEPLLTYWRRTQTHAREVEDDERTIAALVYRAIGSLDDAKYVPILREIYGKMRDHEVRDFFQSIRNMTGEEITELRGEIQQKHGLSNLR